MWDEREARVACEERSAKKSTGFLTLKSLAGTHASLSPPFSLHLPKICKKSACSPGYFGICVVATQSRTFSYLFKIADLSKDCNNCFLHESVHEIPQPLTLARDFHFKHKLLSQECC